MGDLCPFPVFNLLTSRFRDSDINMVRNLAGEWLPVTKYAINCLRSALEHPEARQSIFPAGPDIVYY